MFYFIYYKFLVHNLYPVYSLDLINKNNVEYIYTINACIMDHPFSCMYFIHKQSTCMKKGKSIIQTFTVYIYILI